MARPHTDQEIIDALRMANGSIYTASQLLHCERQTIYNRCRKSPKLQQELDNIREEKLDLVELQLRKLVLSGNVDACIFYLKMFGKDRGYGSSHSYMKPNVAINISCGLK